MQNRKKLLSKCFHLRLRLHANQAHVHVNSFAGVFLLKRKRKATRKERIAALLDHFSTISVQ